MTWTENWEKCFSLGMKPIAIDDIGQQTCLDDLAKSSKIEANLFKKIIDDSLNLDNWLHNLNFWTSGRKNVFCQGKWEWCSTGVEMPPDIKWATGQPDNKGGAENCLHLRFAPTGISFSDRNCTNRYVFACEVKISQNKMHITNTKIVFIFIRAYPAAACSKRRVRRQSAQALAAFEKFLNF
jgi:hypothetical protein